jgi:membrane protein YqaA with SNARE-associated domain
MAPPPQEHAMTDNARPDPPFPASPAALALAAVWGFAEATLFFLVPDVWITLVAAFNPAMGRRAAGASLLGALAGGAVMHRLGGSLPPGKTAALLDLIPAISPAMIADVDRQMGERGLSAMLGGPLRGIPYKLYARTAGIRREPMGRFLLWSIPARGIRFLLAALTAGAIGSLARRGTVRRRWTILPWMAAWTLFYAVYFRRNRG